MMTVFDPALYQRRRVVREDEGMWSLHAFWLPALLFGSIGAITWAIRGTTGWGGIDGTLVPGLTWGLLWYYLCRRRGIDARSVVLWLGLGLAIGGELGYGQYTGWIRGRFNVGEDVVAIAPWVGYAWFAICGIGWGAPGGIVLGWALNSRVSLRSWIVRVVLMALLLVVIFNRGTLVFGAGVVEIVGAWVAQYCPWLIFPNAGMDIYSGELDRHLGRTVYTNTQNALVLVWWVVAMVAALLQRDRTTVVAGAIIGGGFGIGFAQSAAWCLGYGPAPEYVDWWKVWELNSGFNLGVLYVIALNWATRQFDRHHSRDGDRIAPLSPTPIHSGRTSLCLAAAGFVLIFGAGYEYFFWTGVGLATFYVFTVVLAHWCGASDGIGERRRSMGLTYSAFFLVFMLLHGVTSVLGVMLELYTHDAISQYDWPPGRIGLMVAGAIPLVVVTLVSMKSMLKHPRLEYDTRSTTSRLSARMIDLFAGIGIVGAISIWPAKIGPIYAVFLALTLFAFTRIEWGFDEAAG